MNNISSLGASNSAYQAKNGAIASAASADASAKNQPSSSAQVTLSGKAVMLSRLWRINDPSASAPKVLSSVTTNMLTGNSYDFLSSSDRKFLEKVYAYAQEKNIDLAQVDNLATDMAAYRMLYATNGPGLSAIGPGNIFTTDGKEIVYAFNESDYYTAERIKSDSALSSTEVDGGFLRYALDPWQNSVHAVDFKFLERVVIDFSAETGRSINENTVTAGKGSSDLHFGVNGYYVKEKSSTSSSTSDKATNNTPNVLSYLSEQDRKQLIGAYKMLMSLGMSTEQLDQAATRLGSMRMHTVTGQSSASSYASAQTANKAIGAYHRSDSAFSLFDGMLPANKPKNHTLIVQMSSVLEKLLMAEKAEQG